jgi:glycosyltransferase involved in cell wall biosynthesis
MAGSVTARSGTVPATAPVTAAPSAPLYVEVSCWREKHLTGMGRFAARLIESLSHVTDLCLFTTGGRHDVPVAAGSLPPSDAGIEAWARHVLKRPHCPHDPVLARRGAAVYTALRPPVRHFRREIGILYDFTALVLPWAHAPETRAHFGSFFGQTATLCDKLLAISNSTRQDARWLCAAAEDDVVVGYPGPSTCVRDHAHPGPLPRRENVILVVSTLEPRKNAPFLLDWFAATEALPPDMELWWVGPRGWWAGRGLLGELTRRRKGKRGGRIKLLGMVSDRRLCALYQQAAFTIYPSLYEGFGFPVLDSLLHGTPVVCSFNSSLQEFATSGVFYFDACDPVSLDHACRAVLENKPTAIDAAALRRRFSWEALAQTVLALAA